MTRPSVVSLCSGYGGLDLAVEQVFGAETVAVADIDRDACSVLAARFPDVPNLGDLKAVDWSEHHADIITAGYPCQPFSQAGRRLGADDPRHLWPEVLRAIRTVRPRYAVLENVRGHLVLGFDRVLADLAGAGFDAEWVVLRASDIGAPHQRARVFIVATDTHGPGQQVGARAERRQDDRHGSVQRHGPASAHPDGGRLEVFRGGGLQRDVGTAQRHDVDRCGAATTATADAKSARRICGTGPARAAKRPGPASGGAETWGPYVAAVDRWERIIGRPAPSPLNPRNPKQLNAPFVEWMMGLPEGWVTDIVPNRRALHTLGNGVVPQQAAAALRILLSAEREPTETHSTTGAAQ